jgi:hypothetical protein
MRMILSFLPAFLTISTFSQNINLSIDSVNTLLCKKWQVDYALMGNMKIEQPPGATEINYEFLKNGTVIMTTSAATDKDKTRGSWIYDVKNKRVKIVTYNKNTGVITGLNNSMLIMQMNTDKNGFAEGELKMVCKPKMNESTQPEQKQTATPLIQIKNTSLKNPDSAILCIGIKNVIEISGLQGNVSISVTTGATIKKIAENKFEVIPSRKGSFFIRVAQNNKNVGAKSYTAVNK